MKISPFHSCLPVEPVLSDSEKKQIKADYLNHSLNQISGGLDQYILETYQLDLSSHYGTMPISNPWGKASGQLSMNLNQVRDDKEAGLGFVVLKTVIAEDDSGEQSMGEWAIKEARMKVEPIISQSGEKGWTVSWKGRGWSLSFEEYLEFFSQSLNLCKDQGMLIIPSCKYHLPAPGEEQWNTNEYQYTTQRLLDIWNQYYDSNEIPMPLEKDFSPTLAGSNKALEKEAILNWLEKVPEYILDAGIQYSQNAKDSFQAENDSRKNPVMLGLKIFNTMFEDQFQIQMLQKINQSEKYQADFFIYANRLFDPDRFFDGHQGIAYGGPDLSHRNLRIIEEYLNMFDNNIVKIPWSATGNIHSGKMAMEYALRGAESLQIHTYFQLPSSEYSMKDGSRTARALHELYFHPEQGLIAWMMTIGNILGLKREPLKFLDLVGKLKVVTL